MLGKKTLTANQCQANVTIKCLKFSRKSLIRGPNIDEKHCRPGCQRPMPPCAAIIAVHNQQWAKRWSWWWISRKKVLQGYFLLCLIDVTLMLKLLAWGCSSTLSKKVERSKEPVIPGARLQIRICRRLLRFILRSWITTHFCSPSYLSSDK